MADSLFGKFHRFPTTHWCLVDRAGNQDEADKQNALNSLLEQYWPVLKAHLVGKKRIDPHEADDLLQSFIANKVLQRNLIGIADADRGRFRGLLTTALDNYVAGQRRRQAARKRQPENAVSFVADIHAGQEPKTKTPSQVHDDAWAREVLQDVMRRMQTECHESERDDLWSVFEARVVAPIFEGATPADYQTLVKRHDFPSTTHASNLLVTAKRMYARLLRECLLEQAMDESDIETEMQELENCLAQC